MQPIIQDIMFVLASLHFSSFKIHSEFLTDWILSRVMLTMIYYSISTLYSN